jgi:hypothetical protein
VPFLRYPPVVASPFSLDEQGQPKPTYPCPRPGCGREVPVRFKGFGVEHLKHVGWEAYRVESYVNWCGHKREVIPVPREDGLAAFVPVLGEAR